MEITSVLFDLDGTLVDSSAGIEYSCRVALQEVLPGREIRDLRARIGPPIREVFRRALPDVGADALGQLERSFRASYDAEGWRRSVAYPGVAETLSCLRELGRRSFVVTNKPQAPTRSILGLLGLEARFEEVVCPDSRTPPFASKAEEAIDLVRRYGLQPERAALVGDSEEDARAAQACGLPFIAASYGYGRPGWIGGIENAIAILPEFGRLLQVIAPEAVVGRSAAHP